MDATLTHQVMDKGRECGEPRARARSPGRGAGAWHAREWSTKIRPLALRGRDFLLPFYFLVGWLLSLET
jgi:hypothetical protein